MLIDLHLPFFHRDFDAVSAPRIADMSSGLHLVASAPSRHALALDRRRPNGLGLKKAPRGSSIRIHRMPRSRASGSDRTFTTPNTAASQPGASRRSFEPLIVVEIRGTW
jgi:hypothetical protein